jgi:hypothetical protein
MSNAMLMIIALLIGTGTARADLAIHLVSADKNVFLTVIDENNGTKALDMASAQRGVPIFANVSYTRPGFGHIHWYAVTPKDASGNCLWGDMALPAVDDSTVYYISATNISPNSTVKLPCM